MDIDVSAFDRLLTAPVKDGDWVIDTRDPADAQRWHPEGPGIGYLNVPHDRFFEDPSGALAELPADGRRFHVLCARGISAVGVAEVLRESGLDAGIVQGGMAAWSTYHRAVKVSAGDEPFALYQIVRPAKGCLSYLVVSGKQALAVDCTRCVEVYRELAERLGVALVGVADTHLHADHVSGGAKLANGDAPYYLADEDAAGSSLRREDIPKAIRVGETPIDVMSLPVPGHTLGSTAFLVGGRYLISGDTLLPDGIGRPDLGNQAREWTEFLYASLTGVLAKCDPSASVLPAHSASASQFDTRGACVRNLGKLLSSQVSSDRGAFVERVAETVAATTQPPEYAEIRRVNLGEPVPENRVRELETGVNKCALRK